MAKSFAFPYKSSVKSFTLVELIIVIIIVAILAALGLTQYDLAVEKSRLAEARIRIDLMRQLAVEYYMNNGTTDTITGTDVGENNTCASTRFYRFSISGNSGPTRVKLHAIRCTSGGKSPNAAREYDYYMRYLPETGDIEWHCYYTDDSSPCFGLTP